MALKGAYNYAGINLTEAYVRINDIHWISEGAMEMVETKPAVFDRPGGAKIITPAEYGKRWVDKTKTSYTYSIYKDKAAREALPGTKVDQSYTDFDMDTKTDAKNAVEQAYNHLKTKDVFKDMVDA